MAASEQVASVDFGYVTDNGIRKLFRAEHGQVTYTAHEDRVGRYIYNLTVGVHTRKTLHFE